MENQDAKQLMYYVLACQLVGAGDKHGPFESGHWSKVNLTLSAG